MLRDLSERRRIVSWRSAIEDIVSLLNTRDK
jgi:hypothetical protein